MQSNLERLLSFHLKAANVPKWETEFYAIQGRRYRFDFAWSAQRLLVEVQGGTWTQGGHSSGSGIERDTEKLNLATLAGWRVLQVTRKQIESGKALRWIREALGAG